MGGKQQLSKSIKSVGTRCPFIPKPLHKAVPADFGFKHELIDFRTDTFDAA